MFNSKGKSKGFPVFYMLHLIITVDVQSAVKILLFNNNNKRKTSWLLR